ncbi:MAG: four helix bundle protein [Cyclobacteriaceae bacterium]
MKDSIIAQKSFDFAILIIGLYKELIKQNEFVLSKQLLRSSTSIGANVQEALAAVSKKDFLNKMSIASKEARETKYWLRLLDKSQFVQKDYTQYLSEIDEISRVLTSIVKTTKERYA